MPDLDDERVLAETRAWVVRAVLGLDLCPFAKGPHAKDRIRYVVSDASTTAALAEALAAELDRLVRTDEREVETTLLIHPHVLVDFGAFNDFLDDADAVIDGLGLDGIVQIASFHPDYRFAGTAPDDIGNATNRSPYPVLQLLRESSIERAVEAVPDPETIYAKNIATLEWLGKTAWAELRAACRDDADQEPRRSREGRNPAS